MDDNDLLVSVDIWSATATIKDISTALGIVPTMNCSHEKGTSRGRRGVWPKTVWRIDSGIPHSLPVNEHIAALLGIFHNGALIDRSRLPPDVEIELNIGVIQPFFCHTLNIPSEQLKLLGDIGIDVSIAVYSARRTEEGDGDQQP